jgi:hypothetical protein
MRIMGYVVVDEGWTRTKISGGGPEKDAVLTLEAHFLGFYVHLRCAYKDM